jgi:hypothetical protein
LACWPPEDLFAAAIADCIVLNFEAIAANTKLSWYGRTAWTKATLNRLRVKCASHDSKHVRYLKSGLRLTRLARLMFEKAEASCPLSNSLNCEKHLSVLSRPKTSGGYSNMAAALQPSSPGPLIERRRSHPKSSRRPDPHLRIGCAATRLAQSPFSESAPFRSCSASQTFVTPER